MRWHEMALKICALLIALLPRVPLTLASKLSQ